MDINLKEALINRRLHTPIPDCPSLSSTAIRPLVYETIDRFIHDTYCASIGGPCSTQDADCPGRVPRSEARSNRRKKEGEVIF